MIIDEITAKEMQQQLKTLGIAGQTRLQKLASQCFGHPKQRIYPVNSRTARPRKSRTSSQSKTYWAPGISSRPSQDAPLPSTSPKSGLFNVLRLLSNPSGELEPFYDALPVGKRAIVGYGLAVLANLCIVLGGTQYLANNSWQLASVFWISGGLTFVAMVFVLSMLRLCLRMRGSWAADIFILGATFIPLGSFAIAAALIPVGTQFLATPWDRMLTTGGLMLALLWTLSHMSIALRNGLCNIHKFSAATAAWLTPVILGLGLMTGLLTWLFI